MARPPAELEAPVLQDAALGDVEVAQHLDARDDAGRRVTALGPRHVLQHAVEAVLHHRPRGALSRWMSLACAFSVVEQAVDQAHHRAFVGADVGQRQLQPVGGRRRCRPCRRGAVERGISRSMRRVAPAMSLTPPRTRRWAGGRRRGCATPATSACRRRRVGQHHVARAEPSRSTTHRRCWPT